MRAHTAAKKTGGIKLLIGAEFTLDCGLRLVIIARNRAGYGRLSRLITRGRRRAGEGQLFADARRRRRVPVRWRDARDGSRWHARVVAAADAADTAGQGAWMARTFAGRAWIAVELTRDGRDRERLGVARALGAQYGLPLTAAGDVHMHRARTPFLQDALTAVRHGVTLAEAGERLFANGERHLRERERLARLYPRRAAGRNREDRGAGGFFAGRAALRISARAGAAGRDAGFPPAQADGSRRAQALAGAASRENMRARIDYELALIADLDYESYFLTVHDIVSEARRLSILCQGRGSAANSVVCYCLGVTEVDPARGELLMERFISRERNEPPDIDIDFEHERREEVIQYIYRKYGRERTALTATVICYRPRSALRDMAKVIGLDAVQAERLAGAMQWWDTTVDAERIREAGFEPDNPKCSSCCSTLVGQLLGFPRHLSQHVGGFVISQGLLEELVPIENAAMEDRTVIEWDKDDLDDLGLLKVDVLGLGMLSALRRGLELVASFRRKSFGLADIPREDPRVYEMISRADTIGVFQVESRAQMSMLPRLQPREFYDLVIEVAIVRPGPIQGGMVHPYLRRRQRPGAGRLIPVRR